MNNMEPKKESICAVIVTYHPDFSFPKHALSLNDQVGSLVIVDNNSNSSAVSMLRLMACQQNVHLILNDENLGIATALNKGIQWAKDRGYLWTLTLDQDTIPLQSMVGSLIAAYNAYPFNKREIGIIGTNYKDPGTGYLFQEVTDTAALLWKEKKTVITAGSLMSISAYEKTGPFRDEFFIDQVDHEYCLRLQKKGYKVLLSLSVSMIHPVGAKKIHKFLWKKIETKNHAPFRMYYIMRNYTVLMREYKGERLEWLLRVLKRARKEIFRILLFENQKRLKIYAVILGITHGLTKKMGRFNPARFE